MISKVGEILYAKRIVTAALLCLLMAVCIAAPAQADTTYTYTGPAFNDFFGAVCPPVCNITGSFTLSTPLAANDNMITLPGATPFSFSSGPYTSNLANTGPGGIMISTDAFGVIDGWDIVLYDYLGGFYIYTSNDPSLADYDQFARFEPNPPNGVKVDGGADNNGGPTTFGTWTVSTTGVPEPSSVVLLVVGLLGLAGLALKKSN